MNKVLVPLVAVGACLCLGLVFAAGCVVAHHGTGLLVDWGASEKAKRSETRQVPLAEGGRIELEISGGDVDIDAGSAAELELAAELIAFGSDADAARAALERTKLVVEEQSGGARITLEGDTKRKPQANLKLRLPRGVHFIASTGSGSIRTRGPIASSQLKSGYGDVRVAEAQGDLELTSGSGSVDLGALTGATRLVARSGYGSVAARHVEAREIELASSSGNVRLEDARGERIELSSGYGDIDCARIEGELDAKTSSGDVRGNDLVGRTLSIRSSYGDVKLAGARGDIDASSSSGSVALLRIEGRCRARSGYGDVSVEGRISGLQLESSSGSVRANVAEGSKLEGGVALKSGYGDVELALPRASAFELSASTGYGKLDVQFPVTIEAGGLKKERSIRGRVGAGGIQVELKTSSGDVRLLPGS